MTIADLLQIVRKHLASAIISFVVVFAAVAAVTFIMPPKYTATAEVFATYAGQSGETQTTNDMSSGANYLNTQIKTYPELVKTEAVLQPVIKDLGLDMTTTDLADVVTATNPTNTFMVDISAEVGDPQQAADIDICKRRRRSPSESRSATQYAARSGCTGSVGHYECRRDNGFLWFYKRGRRGQGSRGPKYR